MAFLAASPRKEAEMANRLKMATVQSILTSHERGWSQRRIASELDVDRETVSRYVELARQASQPAAEAISKPANAPISGPGAPADPEGREAAATPQNRSRKAARPTSEAASQTA